MTPPWWQPLSQRHFTRSRAHTRLEVVRQQMWQVFFFPFPLDNFLVSTDTRKGRISRYPNRIHTRLDTPQGCCFTCYAALLDTHQEHTQSHAIEFESEMDTRTQGSVAKKVSSFLFFYWRRRKKDVGFVACVCVCVWRTSAHDGHLSWRAQVDWSGVGEDGGWNDGGALWWSRRSTVYAERGRVTAGRARLDYEVKKRKRMKKERESHKKGGPLSASDNGRQRRR